MHENATGDPARSIRHIDWKHLSDDQILALSISDFMAYLGKRTITPGGIEGRDRMLGAVQPGPGSHALVIGADAGHLACELARVHRCKVTAIERSSRTMREAQALVSRLGLADLVHCEVGDINDLRFPDNTFHCVVCQSVFTFVPHEEALSEVGRVLKNDGVVAGLELCWRKLPPDPLRERTAHIFGCRVADFHSLYGWVGALRGSNFDVNRAEEYPVQAFNATGLLRDEGWANSLRILTKLMRRRACRARMAEIWSHFSRSTDYFSYAVFSGCKTAKDLAAQKAHAHDGLALQAQGA